MLRRRDLKGQDEATTDAAPDMHSEPQSATPDATQPQPAASNANITPGGLAWKPMRQTNEEWRPQPRSQAAPGDESLIGAEDFFNGAYRSERGVRVQGRVEGSVESSKHIYIEENAQVMADMNAEDIIVAGRYNGKVECRRRFEITPTGVVTGEINTDLLVVQEGGYFDGKLKMKERSSSGRATTAQSTPGSATRGDSRAATPEEEQSPAQV